MQAAAESLPAALSQVATQSSPQSEEQAQLMVLAQLIRLTRMINTSSSDQ